MATPITKITTHATDAKARLPGWLVDSKNYQGFLDVLSEPYQDIENVLIDMLDNFSLETADGVQLDVIGNILGEPRIAGESDTEYRTRLYGRSAELSKSGEVETLISTWLGIWTAIRVAYDEFQPATFEVIAEIAVDPGDPDQDAAALAAIRRAKGGGVQVIAGVGVPILFLWGDSADADASGDLPVDGDTGWGDSADADANGDITPGAGNGGNFTRIL